jgi:nucleoside-diphosphate-sugar epimerase
MSVHGPVPGPEAASEETARIGRYGHDYSDSKAEQEEIVQSAHDRGDLQVIILRPTIVYGPQSHFVLQVMQQSRDGLVTVFDDGAGICNAIYIDDVCRAIDASLVSTEAIGQAMFINGDQNISWGEFIKAFALMIDPPPAIVNLSSAEALKYWAAHPSIQINTFLDRVMLKLKRLGAPQPLSAPWPPLGRVQRETFPVFFANDKAKQLLGWCPRVDFSSGVARTREWLTSEDYLA